MAATSYNSVAKLLHWSIALAIVGMLALGWVMGDLPNGAQKFALFQLHKSIGITILLLSLFRLVWRLLHKAPALPEPMPAWEKTAAKATHVLFYVLMLGMPLSGWVIVSASALNIPTMLYGLVPWPHLPIIPTLPNKRDIGHLAGGAHGFMAYGMAALIALHVGAALKHHFISRDDVVLRMVPSCIGSLLDRLRKKA